MTTAMRIGLLVGLLMSVGPAGAQETLLVSQATAGDPGLNLTWMNNCAIEVQSGTLPDGSDAETIAQLGAFPQAYKDSTALPGIERCYRVRAYRESDGAVSEWSNVACGTLATGGPSTLTREFTYPGNLNTTYVVEVAGYQCERQVGSTRAIRIRRLSDGVVRGNFNGYPQAVKNVSFTMTCTVTATTVTLAIDGVVKLTAAP